MNGTCDRCAAARRSDGEGAAENEDRASPGEPVAQGMGNHCPKIDTGGEFSGSAVISAAACVRQAESASESGFGEMSAREQMTNPEFTTSVKIGAGGTSPASQPRSALSQAVKIDWWVTVAASTAS